MGLLDWSNKVRRAWTAKRKLDRDFVLQAVLATSSEIFARLDLKERIAKEGQDAMAGQLLERTAAILDARDHRAECRRQLHQNSGSSRC
jgi:chromosome condensin MukBEF complex kleisin-like MukF subunit